MTVIGDQVIYKGNTGRIHSAIVTAIDGSGNTELFVFPDVAMDQWEDQLIQPFEQKLGVPFGTGNETWSVGTAGTDLVSKLAMSSAPTVGTPTRSIGTAFKPNATRPTLCIYSARVTSSLSLSAGASGRIELLSDSANPPTTVRARVAGGSTGTLAVGLNINDQAEAPLIYIVPANHFVLIRTVNEVGTPTYTLGAQVEITL